VVEQKFSHRTGDYYGHQTYHCLRSTLSAHADLFALKFRSLGKILIMLLFLQDNSIQYTFSFLHKQDKIFGQHNNKNYIDGEKRAFRTSEQLADTHSWKNYQKVP
jgi:hypothetical protein